FTATATDDAGDSTTTGAVAATVDTTPPSETISSTIGTNTGETLTIQSGGLTRSEERRVGKKGSDLKGVSSLNLYDGSTSLGTATIGGSGNLTCACRAVADGTDSFTATATDDAGNSTTTGAVAAIVDTTGSSITISSTIGTNTGETLTIQSGGLT